MQTGHEVADQSLRFVPAAGTENTDAIVNTNLPAGANRGFRVGPPRASLSDRCEGYNELTQARARMLLGIKVHAQFTVRSLGSLVEYGL